MYNRSLFIFRRDLRLVDNTGLIEACRQSAEVVPVFIFDVRQVGDENRYKSNAALYCMIQGLQEVDEALQKHGSELLIVQGQAEQAVEELLKKHKAEAVFVNRDYTPFSRKRDEAIAQVCAQREVDFIACNDLLLTEPEDIQTGQKTPYKVYSAFYKSAARHAVAKPQTFRSWNFIQKIVGNKKEQLLKKYSPKIEGLLLQGGRAEGKKLLKRAASLQKYDHERDIPGIDGTSFLSMHHKFGTISIRESYHAIAKSLGENHTLIKELYWRDFFTHIAYHFPYVFRGAFVQKYDKIVWNKSKALFAKWCEGKTGFPIIDAGMRQLNQTGFMHNRVRMIVASFLVKDLHISWRWGEQYFARQLLDYDPSVNNGNWQWVAGTGADAAPYFRIFNPWTQQKKFDPDCTYIKKWIPELVAFPAQHIHKYDTGKYSLGSYVQPIVDHKVVTKQTKSLYISI